MTENSAISTTRIQQIVSLIDLTNLNDECDEAAIETLCEQAQTPVGPVAAICIWPTFVSTANNFFGPNTSIPIATVVNFPKGDEHPDATRTMIDKAISDGATEIDYVLPYTALSRGEIEWVNSTMQSVRNAVPTSAQLKVILETGELATNELIKTAAKIAIDHGADFIKTSTGKVPVNATLNAATLMLDAIADSKKEVGFKAAGGLKTVADANAYLDLADKKMGAAWAHAKHFRFGASSLLQDALSHLGSEHVTSTGQSDSY